MHFEKFHQRKKKKMRLRLYRFSSEFSQTQRNDRNQRLWYTSKRRYNSLKKKKKRKIK